MFAPHPEHHAVPEEKMKNALEKAKKPSKVYILGSAIMVKDLWRETC